MDLNEIPLIFGSYTQGYVVSNTRNTQTEPKVKEPIEPDIKTASDQNNQK